MGEKRHYGKNIKSLMEIQHVDEVLKLLQVMTGMQGIKEFLAKEGKGCTVCV